MFNEKQLEAINTLDGNIRVVAGAGSGKTSVLTHRYAKLIEKGVAPEEILCVTFTNKAANEMKERIEKLVGFSNYTQICTFHSFCLRVLKQSISLLGYTNKFVILDNEDQKAILKKVYKECKINYEEVSYGTALDIISERKINTEDSLIELLKHSPSIKKAYDANAKDLKDETYRDYNKTLKDTIYYGYLYYQQKSNGLDFNDLIIVTVMLFKKEPKILAKWQDRLKYLMVDEFQDVSQRQFELVKMLSEVHGNLFVVGDPDQTIYSWRGAKPEILVDLDKSLKDVKTIIMNQNYRSTPEILQVANELISKNELRIEKDLFTENPSGEKIFFKHLENNKEEADFIVENIERALDKHDYAPQDVAILYRAHFLSRVIEEKLIRSKVPYVIHSGTNFYERKEIKDILSYLKVVMNPKDDIALERIINVPTRGIGDKKLEQIKELAKLQDCSLYEACTVMSKEKGNSKLEDFLIIIDRLKLRSPEQTVYELTQSVLELSGYNMLLKKSLEPERVENVEELLRAIKELPKDTTLEDYLQQIAILTNVDKNEHKNCVTLMTIHSSKGLEFPVVFVMGMSDGIFPSGKVNSIEQVEEERRLAYVAYTRAMKRLILTDSDGYDYNKREDRKTSRFICEMNNDYVIGSRIPHYNFEPLYTPSIYTGCDDWVTRKAQWGKGQYFHNGQYYDWDDDTYCQGLLDVEDIVDACDLC